MPSFNKNSMRKYTSEEFIFKYCKPIYLFLTDVKYFRVQRNQAEIMEVIISSLKLALAQLFKSPANIECASNTSRVLVPNKPC